MQVRIASAPPLRYAPPDHPLLEELVAGYSHITGDPVRGARKRNLVATSYRVHGDDFLPLAQRLFARTGTATNLLGEIRCLAPLLARRVVGEPLGGTGEPASQPASELLPGLIYGEHNRPPFDPTSTRRYDRRPSNPDAAAFFAEDESEAAPRRSPAAEALKQ